MTSAKEIQSKMNKEETKETNAYKSLQKFEDFEQHRHEELTTLISLQSNAVDEFCFNDSCNRKSNTICLSEVSSETHQLN
jgi:hypothetical protein